MFCKNCGAENGNMDKFCHSCGKPLDQMNGERAENLNFNQEGARNIENATGTAKWKAEISKLTQKAKVLPKKYLLGGCAALVVLIVMICVITNAKKTINLNDYLTIEATGYDGYGTAKATIDWDAIEKKYGSKVSFTSKAKKEYGGFVSFMTPVEIIEESVRVKLDTTNDLSNGDKISYTWKVDEDLSKYINCKIKYKDNTYSVSGLEKVGTFDAFADLTVTFSGISPNGKLDYEYTGSELNRYAFNCETYNELSNGDTVKITIDCDMEYCAEQYGKVPESLEKEYKVEGLNSYVTSIADIDDKGLKVMQEQASDVFHSYVARDWDECNTLQSFTYIGNYLLTAKNANVWGTQNKLYLVYKVQSKTDYANEEESFNSTTDYFWFIEYGDLILEENGDLIVDVTDYDTCRKQFVVDSGISSGWWSTKKWHYNGYESLDDLYRDAVTSYMDTYNHEDNIDESLASVTNK